MLAANSFMQHYVGSKNKSTYTMRLRILMATLHFLPNILVHIPRGIYCRPWYCNCKVLILEGHGAAGAGLELAPGQAPLQRRSLGPATLRVVLVVQLLHRAGVVRPPPSGEPPNHFIDEIRMRDVNNEEH